MNPIRTIRLLPSLLLIVAACSPSRPGPARPQPPATVEASFDATWDAAVDQFAEGETPIVTIDRASGLLGGRAPAFPPLRALVYADCGWSRFSRPYLPEELVYNVVIRGDERSSAVRITATWFSREGFGECSTTGIWEAAMLSAIKRRAEGGAADPRGPG